MTVDYTLLRKVESEQRAKATLESAEVDRHLQHDDGGGTSGGMEARIARLESDMEHVKKNVDLLRADVGSVKADTGGLKTDFARLDERVKHLPGKGFVVTATSTTIALLAAFVLFADKLRALIAG